MVAYRRPQDPADVLGLPVESLSADASLLGLGLTSLGAVSLRSKLRSEGIEVHSMAVLLQNATVEAIAVLASQGSGAGGASSVALSRMERSDVSVAYPLSYSQQQMWVLYEMDRDSAAYSVPHQWQLSGHRSGWRR